MATAKQKATEDAQVINDPTTVEDLYAGFSPEELQELLGVSGQASTFSMDKTPILKVNYNGDVEDKDGVTIKRGNFVLGQNSKEIRKDNGDICIEYAGIDLGKNPKITVLTFGMKYSYYNDDAKQRCSSQLVMERGEKPIGNNLGHVCNGGTCPRRKEGVDKTEKCSCQWTVFCEVDVDGTKHKALMYLKGLSFMPFSEYLKEAGTLPLFFFPTELTTKMDKQGSVTYYTIFPKLLKDQPFNQIERKANFDAAKQTKQGAEAFKQQQLTQGKSKGVALLAGPDEGFGAKTVNDLPFDNDEDIRF